MEKFEVYYGLPAEIKFCKKCVISNQRPNATNELRYSPQVKKQSTFIGKDGICDACKYNDMKNNVFDWVKRGKMLQKI